MMSIFISYARADDEPFVKCLYEDLTKHGFDIWWDRVSMPSRALTFLQEIREAIDAADRLILVVGPHAIRSDYVRAEWQYALNACKVVTPILRIGDYDLLPDDLAKLHCPDFRPERLYDNALAELLRILAEPVTPLGALRDVPSLPPHFLPRPEEMALLVETVLADVNRPTVITSARQTTALQGMGGVGKSVLAAAFVRACETRRAFTDGVIWLRFGQQPDLIRNLGLVGQVFNDAPEYYLDLQGGRARLGQVLADKVCLLVLDDIWDVVHAEPFVNALGTRCRLLITTRDGGLATALGAQEHRLDVLSDDAALRLLADWSDLPVEALPSEARDVADECGNLPFALALCGAMARDGTPWADLLEALREADLEFIEAQLPNYPYLDVLKSLKVSVDVLARTDAAGAKHYQELAVFPADEAVPEAAVLTLWLHTDGLSEREARKLLTTLERKALLRLEGQAPQRRISLHDLQHDYLRAVQGDLTGLHGELLEAYRQKCVDGWPSGPNDGYFFQHLAYHLVEAQRVEDLHRLLALETSEQHNAWYEAKDAIGDAAGYMSDVVRAWGCAEDAYDPTESTHTGQSIGLQCCYALITASLKSVAKNIPYALLTALVERGVWTPAQGLTYAQQVPDPVQRAWALAGIAPHLPKALREEALREALVAAREIEDEPDRAQAFSGVAPHLPEALREEALREGLAAAWEIRDNDVWTRVFSRLASHLPYRLLEEALAFARAIRDDRDREIALSRLAPYLPEPLRGEALQEALAAARAIPHDDVRARVLSRLVPHLSDPLRGQALQEALVAARAIRHDDDRVPVLSRLAPYLPEPLLGKILRKALVAARAIESEYLRAGALSTLALHLPEGLLHEALAAAREINDEAHQAQALSGLAPHLPEGLVHEALAVAREIGDDDARARVLSRLAPHLSEPLRGEVLQEALAAARATESGYWRAEVLLGLTPHLPEPLLEEALAAALTIESEHWRACALSMLAPQLAELGYP